MVKEIFFDLLQTALNHYISLDPASTTRLRPLIGKIVQIQFKETPFQIFLAFSSHKVYLLRFYEGSIDVTLSATPFTFLRVWQEKLINKKHFPRDVQITGDAETAQLVNELFQDLSIDWNLLFANVFGDLVGQKVSDTFNLVKSWCETSQNTIQNNITEYLQEEIRLLPPRAEIEDFFNDLDHLRDDVDRASARLKRLTQAH